VPAPPPLRRRPDAWQVVLAAVALVILAGAGLATATWLQPA
jgi:hypothetical protein